MSWSLHDREKNNALIFRIESGRSYVIGRTGADLQLEHKKVSRRHAKIFVADDGNLFLTDLGSSNGTLVNKEILIAHDEKELKHGDEIIFGLEDKGVFLHVKYTNLIICVENNSSRLIHVASRLGKVADRPWNEPPTHCVTYSEDGILSANALRCALREKCVVSPSWLEACASLRLDQALPDVNAHAPDNLPTAAKLRRIGKSLFDKCALIFCGGDEQGHNQDTDDEDDLELLVSELSPQSALRYVAHMFDQHTKYFASSITHVAAVGVNMSGEEHLPVISREDLINALISGKSIIKKTIALNNLLKQRQVKDDDDKTCVSQGTDIDSPAVRQDKEDLPPEYIPQHVPDIEAIQLNQKRKELSPPQKSYDESPGNTKQSIQMSDDGFLSLRHVEPDQNLHEPTAAEQASKERADIRRIILEDEKFVPPEHSAATKYQDDLIITKDTSQVLSSSRRGTKRTDKAPEKSNNLPNFKRFRKNYVLGDADSADNEITLVKVRACESDFDRQRRLQRQQEQREEQIRLEKDLNSDDEYLDRNNNVRRGGAKRRATPSSRVSSRARR